MAMEEHMPYKADTTRLRSIKDAKHLFSYLDFRCYFEADVSKSHPFSAHAGSQRTA